MSGDLVKTDNTKMLLIVGGIILIGVVAYIIIKKKKDTAATGSSSSAGDGSSSNSSGSSRAASSPATGSGTAATKPARTSSDGVVMRMGSKGGKVKEVQQKLNKYHGAFLKVDGVFGSGMKKALEDAGYGSDLTQAELDHILGLNALTAGVGEFGKAVKAVDNAVGFGAMKRTAGYWWNRLKNGLS